MAQRTVQRAKFHITIRVDEVGADAVQIDAPIDALLDAVRGLDPEAAERIVRGLREKIAHLEARADELERQADAANATADALRDLT